MSPKRPASPSTEPDAKRRCSGDLQGTAIEATAAVYYVADRDLELLHSGPANDMISSGSSSGHSPSPSPAVAIAGSPNHSFSTRLTNFDVIMSDASNNAAAGTAAFVPPPSTLSAAPSSTTLPSLFTPAPTGFGGTLRPPTFPPPPRFGDYSLPSVADHLRLLRRPLHKRRASEPTMPMPFVYPCLAPEIIRALPPHLRPRNSRPPPPVLPPLPPLPPLSALPPPPPLTADNTEALLAFFSEGREIHVNRLRAKILRLTAEIEKLRKRDAELVALREEAGSRQAEMEKLREQVRELEEEKRQVEEEKRQVEGEKRQVEEEKGKVEKEARTQQEEIKKLHARNEDLRKKVHALEADLTYTQTITSLRTKWDREAAEAEAYEGEEGDEEFESDSETQEDIINDIIRDFHADDADEIQSNGSAESEGDESEELQSAKDRIQELEAENAMLREHMHGYDPSHPPQAAPARRTGVQSDDEAHETEALDPAYATVLRGVEAQLDVLQIANNGLSQQNHSLVGIVQTLRTERDGLSVQLATLQGELDRVRLSHTRAWWENGTLQGNLGVLWEVNSALGTNNGQLQAAPTSAGQAAHGQEQGFVGFAPLQANPPPPYVPPMLVQELAQLQLLGEAAGPAAPGGSAIAPANTSLFPLAEPARAPLNRPDDRGSNIKVQNI